ncbi:hypothetical protein [Castellaniella sp.]|uniref:hypothetical protein n=1 Tax=Castellaniella sp. TaxID=1955812 RepID=UPI002B000F9E|nr:hypothetical protein [Castellaniella sp.]
MTNAATFTDAELFNCWSNGKNPRPDEIALFDALEVCGVRNAAGPDEDGTVMEACGDRDAEFWSVYGHYRPTKSHGGVICITDGPEGDRARAWEIAHHLGKLWNLPVDATFPG